MPIVNRFSYFTDPLPSEEEYSIDEWKLANGAWDRILEALEDSQFVSLPEEIDPINGHDFSSFYIEVATKDTIYRSGGYGAGCDTDKVSKRFKKVWNVIFECLDDRYM